MYYKIINKKLIQLSDSKLEGYKKVVYDNEITNSPHYYIKNNCVHCENIIIESIEELVD